MAEDDPANESTLADLSSTDIRTNVYEGGFKTWECSVDLSSLLLDRGPRKDIDEIMKCDQVIEVSFAPFLSLQKHYSTTPPRPDTDSIKQSESMEKERN